MTALALTGGDEATAPSGFPSDTASHHRRWLVWFGVLVVVLGCLWYGLSRRSGGPTVSATVADCSQAFTNQSFPSTGLRPVVVGLGSVASIAVIQTPNGPAWCFDGMGTGTGGIGQTAMRSTVDVPVTVIDGNSDSDVLMLVHLGAPTASVVVTTAESRSNVLASGGGFEVLRVPTTGWPHWHAPWARGPVPLGRIIGFDHEGRVTSNQAFSWCPGSINDFPVNGSC